MKIDNKKKLENFFDFIRNNNQDYGLSSLWKKYINDFNINNLNKYRPSYGINYNISNNRIITQLKLEKFFFKLNNLIFKINDRFFKFFSSLLSFFGYSNHRKYGLYITGNKFFNISEIDEDFRVFLLKHLNFFSWKYSYMTVKAAYNLFSFSKIVELNKLDDKNIIEVGSGMCQFSSMISSNLNSFTYVCLDLPNMIPHGYKTFTDNLNLDNIEVFLPHEIKDFNNSKSQKKIIFILPNQINEIGLLFDVLINIESFGEMPQSTANNYINSIKKKMNRNALIFLINRIARCVDLNDKTNLKSWTLFSEYPLEDFDILEKKVDDFKDLNSNIEGNRSNILFVGKKIN